MPNQTKPKIHEIVNEAFMKFQKFNNSQLGLSRFKIGIAVLKELYGEDNLSVSFSEGNSSQYDEFIEYVHVRFNHKTSGPIDALMLSSTGRVYVNEKFFKHPEGCAYFDASIDGKITRNGEGILRY